MPELPEVETIIQELNDSHLLGSCILRAEVFWHRSIGTPAVHQFLHCIKNQKIVKIIRKGKYIIFHLSDGYLVVHLRMTGLSCLHRCIRLILIFLFHAFNIPM